jgi:hypothetical protein
MRGRGGEKEGGREGREGGKGRRREEVGEKERFLQATSLELPPCRYETRRGKRRRKEGGK